MPASDAISPMRALEIPSRANTRHAARRISCSRRMLRSCFLSRFSPLHLATNSLRYAFQLASESPLDFDAFVCACFSEIRFILSSHPRRGRGAPLGS